MRDKSVHSAHSCQNFNQKIQCYNKKWVISKQWWRSWRLRIEIKITYSIHSSKSKMIIAIELISCKRSIHSFKLNLSVEKEILKSLIYSKKILICLWKNVMGQTKIMKLVSWRRASWSFSKEIRNLKNSLLSFWLNTKRKRKNMIFSVSSISCSINSIKDWLSNIDLRCRDHSNRHSS